MASDGSHSPDPLEGNETAYDPDWQHAIDHDGDGAGHEQEEEEYPITQADQDEYGSQASADIDEDSAEYDPEYDPEPAAGNTEEYNPESVVAAPAPTQTLAPANPVIEERSVSAMSTRPTKKPKTAGGFLVESSDDENDTPAPAPTILKPAPGDTSTLPASISLPQSNGASQYNYSANTTANSIEKPLTTAAPVAKSRLPTDIVGSLEDRIQEDPKGDTDAWFTLIEEFKRRHQIEDARKTYERFLEVFPQSAETWVEYLNMELSLDNFVAAEGIFSRTLFSVPHVQLWTAYLNYVRRRNDLNDPSGQTRQTVSQAYEFVLNNVGQDRDAGTIWQDYITFIKSGPGQIGGSSWQDQQKMDLLRKAYQRAICVPIPNLNVLWKEYDSFEMGLNKMTGRKHLQERSPAYMTARSANTALENITRGLNRTTLPRLPPAPGFDGDQEFLEQVKLWKDWIEWEKDDPLVLKSDDLATYQQRVLHVYRHALMALRFWPEMWVDAAEWCADNGITKDNKEMGLSMLVDGVAANPESALLALKHADYIELTQRTGEDDESKSSLAQAVRAPYDKVLDTLYAMVEKVKKRKEAAIAKIEQETVATSAADALADDDDDDEGEIKESSASANAKQEMIKAVEAGFAVQTQMLSQQISYLWIALCRAFRRFQGQGKTSPPTGLRGIFTEARGRGRLSSDVYIAIAHIEWDVYQDPVATKIFERGAKLFPNNEDFFVEYLKHLHARRDFTNARVVFSQTVKRFRDRLADQPELLPQLKPLYAYFHSYEAKYGELAQVRELEKQMAELFPNSSDPSPFAARFATEKFNPINARVIISPAQQMRPKMGGSIQSIEYAPLSVRTTPQPVAPLAIQPDRSPRFQNLTTRDVGLSSPKRPFQADDGDDFNPPRKVARGVSPLKGAAGRRLDQQRRQGGTSTSGPIVSIPRDITFLIGQIPSADNFNPHQFNPERMVRLIRETPVPDFSEWKSRQDQGISRSLTRPASSDYQPYQRPGQDPQGISGRPASPYGGPSRSTTVQSQSTYRNSPLRPGSSGSYEPPPASYQPPGPSPFNPITQHHQSGLNNAYGSWQNSYADNNAQYSPSHQTHQAQPPSYNGYY
ncbi:hypothetical protein F5Y16DRAFT_386802 [Xylariaceae sp. FL0255]|nr:hypothetical protein F5Y16DRAFT_386802 [Xylariaceae sp. FL0255]